MAATPVPEPAALQSPHRPPPQPRSAPEPSPSSAFWESPLGLPWDGREDWATCLSISHYPFSPTPHMLTEVDHPQTGTLYASHKQQARPSGPTAVGFPFWQKDLL